MSPHSPLLHWREIVYPLFWPVFFWNLRRFVRFMHLRIEAGGGEGLISYEVTWWGAIRIDRVVDPDGPAWDAALAPRARRVHLATLDVGNPYLSQTPQRPLEVGLQGWAMIPGIGRSVSAQLNACARRPLPAMDPSLRWGLRNFGAGPNAGCFAEPGHLNSS